ncbi:MAG TPA: histidine kinase, partial [Candidatus Competibacteraceae bacterium]|nr:histidine kinase [Candidatus Competibacteraceae bacterium]
LAETDVSDRQRGMIDTIRTSGEGLLTILNDILDLAKIEAGKMVVESQPYSPAEVIGRVGALFAPRAATADLALSVPITPELATPRQGDSNRLLQILTNLVGNAIKF